uniref:TPR_REGION domain-containing protein n=1 Tax=Heterorhabditis bacteriophora TaxID=37862 RepID=A0A1I7XS61_HETBA
MLDTSSISIGSVAKPVLEGFKVVADLQWLIDSCEQRLMTDTMKFVMLCLYIVLLDLATFVITTKHRLIEFCAQLGANGDGSAQWMCDWFAGLALARFHFDRHAIKKSEVLVARGMTGIPMIMTQIAACSNHIHEHDTTLEMFKRIQEMDPFRIDHMNLYSDSLYIRGERVLLADLAHTFFRTHKFTWETCCIVGNYYGMRRENEQAIRFFQRALRLNPGVASIWVLIGHEFMELKNNSAACMSYRKAIEVDESDYRGWYGLGQLYDILKMQSYSLYYYQQAHKCK